MLESCLNQAAGLQGLSLQIPPKLIAIASHGNQQGELPLLWSLCTKWVDMGLPVAVLDGHARETDENPGFLHWMSNQLDHIPEDPDAVAWSVLPASAGLTNLAYTGFDFGSIGHCFKRFGVVVIYATADVLSNLLKGSNLSPMLVVTPVKASSLTGYRALKQLVLHGHLYPTVANIELGVSNLANRAQPVQNLQECASAFLGITIHPVTVSAASTGDASRGDINRLALQLLESAVFLESQPIPRKH